MKKAFLIFCCVLLSLSAVQAQNPDINLLRRLNAEQPAQQHFWLGISNSAYWVPPAYVLGNLAYGLAANDHCALRYSLETAISAGISMAISGGLKQMINRQRPSQSYPESIHTYSFTDGKSFPSGHTTIAFATATTMAFQSRRWYITVPIITWPISVGYSRMRLGKHYPSDVLAGALIGIGSGLLSHWITNEIVH